MTAGGVCFGVGLALTVPDVVRVPDFVLARVPCLIAVLVALANVFGVGVAVGTAAKAAPAKAIMIRVTIARWNRSKCISHSL